jgi:hypothetical protein
MGSLVYVELLDNPRYREFLNRAMLRAFSWIGKAGIKHFFMTPFIAATKNNRSGIVHFSTYFKKAAWTSSIWICPLLVRNVDSVMIKLSKIIVSLLLFAKPNPRLLVGLSLHKRWPGYRATGCHPQLLSPLCGCPAGF